jgi:hypothetical protein
MMKLYVVNVSFEARARQKMLNFSRFGDRTLGLGERNSRMVFMLESGE